MSRKSVSTISERNFFDTGSGHVFADNANTGHHSSSGGSVKSKVDFIYGAVSQSRSKNDILLVLQSCDYIVEAAISIFARDEAEEVLKTWRIQGKKSKNGNSKKKRNKKKQLATREDKEVDHEEDCKIVAELVLDDGNQDLTTPNKTVENHVQVGLPLNLKPGDDHITSLAVPSPTSSPSSSDTSALSEPSTPNEESPSSGHLVKTSHASSHGGTKKQPPKLERISSTSGPEVLKKTIKDLCRSSVSLARYQVVLEEECDRSFKRIVKSFQDIRKCLNDREVALLQDMTEFKAKSVALLQQRQENAAAFKLKAERVAGMTDDQVALLRADIKNFVAERKIDEEVAQTTRFVGEEEELLQHIRSYGEIIPIKSIYTPVVLNRPVTPSIKKSDMVMPSNTPTPSKIQAAPSTVVTSAPLLTTSVTSATLQDAAEIHVRLKEAIKQQGVANPVDRKEGSHDQPSARRDQRKNVQSRPRTAPQYQQDQPNQQTSRPWSSRNPAYQSNEKGRSSQRQGVSQPQMKSNQPSEKQFQSSQRQQEGGNDRPPRERRRRRDGRPRAADESPRGGGTQVKKASPSRPPRHVNVSKEASQSDEQHAKNGPVEDDKVPADDKSHPKAEITEERPVTPAGEGATSAKGLPQREPRQQNRRRSQGRGRDRGSRHRDVEHGNREERSRLVNGASNGLETSHDLKPSTKKAKEPSKEEVQNEQGSTDTAVIVESLVNGHDMPDKSHQCVITESTRTDQEKLLNGYVTTNGVGEECIVER